MATRTTNNQENQRELRELDKKLGQQYRTDPSAVNISYIEYRKIWKEAQRVKNMKTRYSLFEPMPNESPLEFKKRNRTVTLEIPVETIEDYNARIERLMGVVR